MLVRNRKSHEQTGNAWRVRPVLRASPVWAEVTANVSLRWLSASGDAGGWESTGDRECFTLDQRAVGGPLGAGWYELRGCLQVAGGGRAMPSVRLRYAERSALTDVELMLPEPDTFGCIRTLLLFLDDIESLQFSPGAGTARFRLRDFSLCRVSRRHALRVMLGGPASVLSIGGIRRLFAWGRAVRNRGLKRATDELYADYRRRMRPRRVSEYATWIRRYDRLDDAALEASRRRALTLGAKGVPLISVLLRVGDTSEQWLRRGLDSVLAQVWEHWELCVAFDASMPSSIVATLAEYATRDPRVSVVPRNGTLHASDPREDALVVARGEFVVLLDASGELRPQALLRVAEALAVDRELALLYSDEDRLDVDGSRCDPDFKPEWNPDLLRSQNYVGHFVAIRAALVREAGGFRTGFEGSGDHDLILRCSERVLPRRIHHIPEILYHGRADSMDPAATAAGMRAMAEHLERIGSAADAQAGDLPPGLYRIRWPLPQPAPKISLIIPTRDRVGMLRRCVESILARSTYPDFEVVVVDNQSSDRGALGYLRELAGRERVRVLRYDAPFNFSAINNWAARQCTGPLLALVNNDIEVVSPDWLEEMAGFAVRPGTGAVGAMLYYPDDTIQHAGMLLGIHGVAGHVYAGKPRGHHGYHGRALVAQNLSAVTGACMLVRRELFEAVGGMDEQLPIEFNDVDFCMRLRQRGYLNVWTPFACMYHHESASRALEDAAAKTMREAGIALMMDRWRDALRNDPAYNPNLSLESLDFGLAFPPRSGASGVVIDR